MTRAKEGYRCKQERDAGNDRDQAPNHPNAEKAESHHVT